MEILQTSRLIIRNWRDNDRAIFHALNADPAVMQYFPTTLNRKEADLRFERLQTMITETGFGFYALEEKASCRTIGMCGLLKTNLEPFIKKNTVEIGWRLLPPFWGKGYITEAAKAILAYGFQKLDLEEIISFAVKDNKRSVAVMQRLGMVHLKESNFDHPRVPENCPALKRHVLYRLLKKEFQIDEGKQA